MESENREPLPENISERYRALIDGALFGVGLTGTDGRVLEVNAAFASMLGYDSPADLIGKRAVDFYVNPNARVHWLDVCKDLGMVRGVELQLKRKDGQVLDVRLSVRAVRDAQGNIYGFESIMEDITQQRTLEKRLQMVEKLDAIGQLAGGIAHDFNNSLGVIIGHSELLLERLPPDSPARKHANAIKDTGLRAANLTRKLLAYSRQQIYRPEALNLNDVVTETSKTLRTLIGENIELVAALDPSLGKTWCDPAQIDQIVTNLVVNSRDAMPDGGRITIETANRDLDDLYRETHPVVKTGPYVMLSVSDTGVGMSGETMKHIFEPFFTTKGKGSNGTGLGLSSVYGITKQSDGYVWPYSEPGLGTTMKVYFPRLPEENLEKSRAVPPRSEAAGQQTILVVEDEELLRRALSAFVISSGYRVLEASDGFHALDVAAKHQGDIHLLITDAVMPGMTGRQLAEKLQRSRPGIQILYISGYTDDTIIRQGLAQGAHVFLQKPFTKETLMREVDALLRSDRPPTGPSSDK